MDKRLQDGEWMQRARAAQAPRPRPASAAPEGLGVGIPIGDDYAAEQTEWTPLTRRAAAGAFTPVPVSRRTGLIAGGVVLGAGGLGVVGSSVVALTVGLLIGAAFTADRMELDPMAALAPAADTHQGEPLPAQQAPVRAQRPAVPVMPTEVVDASEAPEAAAPRPSVPARPKARRGQVARTASPPAAAPSAPAPAKRAPSASPTPRPPVVAAAEAPAHDDSWAAAASGLVERMAAAGPAPAPAEAPPAYVPPAAPPVVQAPQADLLASSSEAPDPLDALVAGLHEEKGAQPDPELDDLLADDDLPTQPSEQGWMASASSLVGAGVAALSASDGVAVADAAPAAAPAYAAPVAAAAAPAAPYTAPPPPASGTAAPGYAAPAPAYTAPDPSSAYTAPAPAAAAPAYTAPAPAAAPAYAAPAPVAAAAPAYTAPAPAAAAAPAYTAPAPAYTAPTPAAAAAAPTYGAPAPAAAPPTAPASGYAAAQAPAAPACYGELCGDSSALSYVDDGSGTDLLSNDPDDWSFDPGRSDPAAQFASPEADLSQDDMAAQLDSLGSMLVEIRSKRDGVQVIVDGAPAGVTPLHIDMSEGYHTVKLVGQYGEQSFQLRPQSDPETWCFESKGRGYKLESCR